MKTIQKTSLLVLFWLLLSYQGFAQYGNLEDKDAIRLTRQAIDSIYNLNFRAADKLIHELDGRVGGYPGVLLLRAFYMSWKFRPIKKDQQAFVDFEKLLNRSVSLCDSLLAINQNDPEATFFKLTSHAYLAQLYSDNGMNMKALGEAKEAYNYMKAGFDMVDQNPEFYFPCGIYNYYREKYPEENPFYKSFIWFFRSGDKAEGIDMLKRGKDTALFDNIECITYLFHIYLRYENNPSMALPYARHLKEKYPKNLVYTSHFIENSIRMNQYAGLEALVGKLLDSEMTFYEYLGEIYAGYLAEMVEKNYPKAIEHFKKADKLGNMDNVRVSNYDSILFYGMGRTYRKMGLEDLAQHSLKQSVKNAEYKAYRSSAEELLHN